MSEPRPIRAYVDTSVFGGCFDQEFATSSVAFFERVARREIVVLMSGVTDRELVGAPENVRLLAASLRSPAVIHCQTTPEIMTLADAYVASGVLGPRWVDDAMHVATATIHRADVLVSWNFKHLVRIDRARGFNAVNARLGHPSVVIASPLEVQYADRQEDI